MFNKFSGIKVEFLGLFEDELSDIAKFRVEGVYKKQQLNEIVTITPDDMDGDFNTIFYRYSESWSVKFLGFVQKMKENPDNYSVKRKLTNIAYSNKMRNLESQFAKQKSEELRHELTL